MKLKLSLLMSILENHNHPNKYSKAFLNLKNVFELEKEEKFEFPKKILTKFDKISEKYESFMSNIPLLVIERYHLDNISDTKKFVYLEFEKNELTDIKIIDLYLALEGFYSEMFNLGCTLASYYNLEIKFNNNNSSNNFV